MTKDKIVPLLQMYPDAFIAKHLGVSREWIRQIRNKIGIPCENPHTQVCKFPTKGLSEEQWGELLRNADQNVSLSVLAKTYKISRHGLTYEKLGMDKRIIRSRVLSVESLNILKTSKKTVIQLAKELNISPMTVYRWRKILR